MKSLILKEDDYGVNGEAGKCGKSEKIMVDITQTMEI